MAVMKISPETAAELHAKHLEMIQGVVTRMSNQAATLKNYGLTLTVAACGFAATFKTPALNLIALFAIAMFWLLDAQYVRLERNYRILFDDVRRQEWGSIPTFELNANSALMPSLVDVARGWSTSLFYGPLAFGVIVVTIIGYSNGV